MTTYPLNLNAAHSSWRECLSRGISKINPDYLTELNQSTDWLPGADNIFNAFSLPLDQVNYVLFGESPYPRRESANGYAFWDAAVNELWSGSGLSKKVNRATSLRNILKMMLIAEGCLDKNHTSQEDILRVNKQHLIQTNQELFSNFLNHGFLLLNATPVLHADTPQKDARAWYPFTAELLACLVEKRPNLTFILFGRIAKLIEPLLAGTDVSKLYAEHPYNISFITNDDVLSFFKSKHLLRKPLGD